MSRDERGFALIVVLLVVAVVGVVGAEFAYSMRLEATAVRAYKDGIIGSHLAEAAVAQATREIVADAPYVTVDERGVLTFYTRERLELPRLPREKVEYTINRMVQVGSIKPEERPKHEDYAAVSLIEEALKRLPRIPDYD